VKTDAPGDIDRSTTRIGAMSILKKGSTGSDVKQLQDSLRELGFDADGTFGDATHAAVVAFQRSRGLLPDGIVGPATRSAMTQLAPAIDDAPAGAGPKVDRSVRLSARNYISDVYPKDLIVLHHTVGGTARSSIAWWESQSSRIATAYVIERDGTIHEVFDPRYWAYHLGVQGVGAALDRRSIGIELACEGPVTKSGAGYSAFGREFKGKVFDNSSGWRGQSRYWAAYPDAQVASACELVSHLCAVFGIPRQSPSNHIDFNASLYSFKGVIGHHHVRADKSDPHPGFPWDKLKDGAGIAWV
jgi:N-acetyl-anhydromuramyl-L-alanine amidase AmpD